MNQEQISTSSLASTSSDTWSLVIRPHRKWFDLKLGDNAAFDLASLPTDGLPLSITGIFDQEATSSIRYSYVRLTRISPSVLAKIFF